jgi:hypothetical protein
MLARLVALALLFTLALTACDGGGGITIVGTWQARTDPQLTWRFSGASDAGTFVFQGPGGDDPTRPPGCRLVIRYFGRHVVSGSLLTSTVERGEGERVECTNPLNNDAGALALTPANAELLSMSLSGEVTLTATTLEFTTGGSSTAAIFDRIADAPVDAGRGGDAGPPGSCGTETADVSGLPETMDLAIGRDGTVWFSTGGGRIGRVDRGGAARIWTTVASGLTLPSVALSADNTRLFVSMPPYMNVVALDTGAAVPMPATIASIPGYPSALTLGPDGLLYMLDQMGSHVFSVSPAGGTPRMVNTSPLPGVDLTADGFVDDIAFGADGSLLVPSPGTGTVERLILSGGVESARTMLGTGLGVVTGVAADADGTLYLGDIMGSRLLPWGATGPA